MSAPMDVLAGLVDRLGPWGRAAQPLQVADASSLLGDGPRRQWWSRTRGWSKTRDASAVLLAAMLTGQVPPDEPAYCGAADADQAALVLQSMRAFVKGSHLSRRVVFKASTVTDRETGGQLIVLPADSAGSLGLRPSWALLDELANWPTGANAQSFYEALSSGVAKTQGRLLIISTAGLVGHWSQSVFAQAESDEAWRVSVVHEPPPWIPASEIEIERRRLPHSSFLRYWVNEWASPEDRLASEADVDACVRHSGPLAPVKGTRYVMSADLGVKVDPTVACVMHTAIENDRHVYVVDRLRRWVPSPGRPVDLDDVKAWLIAMHHEYRPIRVEVETWQAFKLLGELRASGMSVREFVASAPSSSQLALAVFEALRDQTLVLPDDPDLLRELKQVRLVASAGAAERFRLDHASGHHNDQAIAIGIALLALLKRGSSRGARMLVPQGVVPPARLTIKREHHEPGPQIVKPGEERPVDKLRHFQQAKKHPRYQAPGTWRRP